MSKRRKILFILIFIVILGLLGYGAFIFYSIKQSEKTTTPSTLKDYFPFGQGGQTKTIDSSNGEGTLPDNTTGGNTIDGTQSEYVSKLRKITGVPTAGFDVLEREIIPDELDIARANFPTVTINPTGTFYRDLQVGSRGEDVKRLQVALNACPELGLPTTGIGSAGKETEFFVSKTADNLKKLQKKLNLVQTGILDEQTRIILNGPFSCRTEIPKIDENIKSVARYVEKGTGHIYQDVLESGKNTRITNTTIPRIAEAFFMNDGKNVLLRYLRNDNQTIETYSGLVPEPAKETSMEGSELSGSFLETNIFDIVLSPNGKQFYNQTSFGSQTLLSLGELPQIKKTQLLVTPFSEWLGDWPADKTVTIQTKASGYVPGYFYKIDTDKKTPEKVLGGILGLTAKMSPNGQYVLFTETRDKTIQTSLYNTQTRRVFELGLNTLPEKCTWNKESTFVYCAVPGAVNQNLYPDAWYQGIESFSDTFYRIDPTKLLGNQKLFNGQEESNQSIDGINLKLNIKQTYLTFINKIDGSLWTYSLQ